MSHTLQKTLADMRRCRLILAGSHSTRDMDLCDILDHAISRLERHMKSEASDAGCETHYRLELEAGSSSD